MKKDQRTVRSFFSAKGSKFLVWGLSAAMMSASLPAMAENSAVTKLADVQTVTQTKTVTGTVLDESGEPMIGVSVLVKGTTTGAVTDIDGKFSLGVSSNSVLVISYIGFHTQEIKVGNQKNLVVKMVSDDKLLDEVVVVGYGTVKKRDLTGAVASVSSAKIKERSYSNVMQSLSGQMPGVNITQNSGAPGMAPTIKVRGASSINAGTSPLYVIDGVPLEDATPSGNGQYGTKQLDYNNNPLNSINPNDIESVEILKDASSAAIYGSRGANGVVLITTKQGKAGKTKIDASYEFGVSEVARKVEMMNAKEFIEYTRYSRNNTWATAGGNINDPNSVRPFAQQIPPMFDDPEWLERIGEGTDWQDVLFQTGKSHNFQVSASGGTEKTQFMISSGYLKSDGVVENTYYNRLNVRSNIRHQLTKDVKVGANLAYSRSTSQMFGDAGKSDAVSFALQSDPIFPVVNENGNYSHRDPNSIWNVFQPYYFQLWHPYIFTRESQNKKTINNVLVSGFLEYSILKNLLFKSTLSGTMDNQFYNDYRNAGQKYGHEQYRPAEANECSQNMFNWIWENTLNYNQTFGDHSITALLGYSAQKQTIDNSQKTGSGFPNDLVKTMNAATTITNAGSTQNQWALVSYLARATYAYKGKYMASFAIREDGCSRFGKDSRWGSFPSASLGWRVSEEKFMQSTKGWLDNLKLRLSYGVTGNNQIPNYGSIGLLSYSPYVLDNSVISGMYTGNYADKKLKWEKTAQTNIGVDFSLFDNRINVSYDYYFSRTKDMLMNVEIPSISGFTSTLTNIGEIKNQGMEFHLATRNLVGAFKWDTDFNISGNRNEVVHIGTNDAPIIMSNNSCNIIIEKGKPLGNYYGYIVDGVIMSKAELTQYPVFKGSEAGDPKVRDANEDGVVDSNDRTVIGNYQPDFTIGLTNNFSYKNFELSFMITGSYGGEIMNQQARFTKTGRANRGVYKSVFGFWRSEENPGDGIHYKPREGQNTMQNQCSSYWVEDGSFTRIKNIRLGYNMPSSVTKRLGISGLKLYVNVENVYVFSDYSNYDPEASSFQTGIFNGFDYASYPNPRVWSMGVNFSF